MTEYPTESGATETRHDGRNGGNRNETRMFRSFRHTETAAALLFLLNWLAWTVPLGILTGSACSLFLWLLDLVTQQRTGTPALLYLLPAGGAATGFLYHRFGQPADAGNNLIIDEIHEPEGRVPTRMAPLVLAGTLVTHLFGGSAGREGTAVQMGGSLAAWLGQLIPGTDRQTMQTLLMCGISGGFAGVFGTPAAGAVFGVEVLVAGRARTAALVPCMMAALISDRCCLAWGTEHTLYSVSAAALSGGHRYGAAGLHLLICVVGCAIGFGLVSRMFSEMQHTLQTLFQRMIKSPIWRPAVGGLIVILLVRLLGTRDFLGLGVSSDDTSAVTILSCFQAEGSHTWSWLWKLIFTVVTVASGFRGGEVTPLFFIGAALGNTLSGLLGVPADLFAALGFVSVFAGATNTPVACIIMAVELFGGDYTVCFAVSCVVACLFSGNTGIYGSQRIPDCKATGATMQPNETIRSIRQKRWAEK